MDTSVDTPREKRNSVIVRAAVVVPGGSAPSERRIRNLSRSGACVEHDGDVREGMTLLLHMGTLTELPGEVMWVRGRLAGLRFAEAIDLEEARKPRGLKAAAKAGWMADINDAYRRL